MLIVGLSVCFLMFLLCLVIIDGYKKLSHLFPEFLCFWTFPPQYAFQNTFKQTFAISCIAHATFLIFWEEKKKWIHQKFWITSGEHLMFQQLALKQNTVLKIFPPSCRFPSSEFSGCSHTVLRSLDGCKSSGVCAVLCWGVTLSGWCWHSDKRSR